MSDILDGSGEIITDGDGGALFDGDGVTDVVTPITVTTVLEPFLARIRRHIKVPDFVILPDLYEVLKEFTRKTWLLYKTYEVSVSGVAASVLKSIAFDISATVPGLVPVQVHRLKSDSGQYKPVMKDIIGPVTLDMQRETDWKYYNFFAVDAGVPETYIRVFPWGNDVTIYLSVAFRTPDEPSVVPAVLLDYVEAICSGVLSKMMIMAGSTWANPDLAGYHESRYQAGIREAMNKWFTQNTMQECGGKKSFI